MSKCKCLKCDIKIKGLCDCCSTHCKGEGIVRCDSLHFQSFLRHRYAYNTVGGMCISVNTDYENELKRLPTSKELKNEKEKCRYNFDK